MVASWATQLGATVKRNFLIKLRDGSQTLQEIFLPVYIIMLLIIVKLVQPEIKLPAVPMSPAVDASCVRLSESGTGGSMGSICEGGFPRTFVLVYTPSNVVLKRVVETAARDMATQYPLLPPLKVISQESDGDVQSYYQSNPGTMFAAVEFDGVTANSYQLPADLRFTIRINGSVMVPTSIQVAGKEQCRPADYSQGFLAECYSQKYFTSGFLALDSALTRAIAHESWKGTVCENQHDTLVTDAMEMDLPPYYRSFASVKFQLFTAMYMVWALIPLLQVALTQIVQEKETLLKDCMLLMGLRESVYWLSWMFTYAATAAITSLVLTVAAWVSTLFSLSHVWAVFVVIFPYCLSLVAMAFALSTLFSQAQRAGAFAAMLLLCSSLLIIPIELLQWPAAVCVPLMLFSPVAFTIAISTITKAEGAGEGLTLSSSYLWSTRLGVAPGDPSNSVTVGACVLSFVIDTVLYLVLAWYLDNVWPHPDRGPKMPPGFVFSRDYWFPHLSRQSVMYTQVGEGEGEEDEEDEEEEYEQGSKDIRMSVLSHGGGSNNHALSMDDSAPINTAANSSAPDPGSRASGPRTPRGSSSSSAAVAGGAAVHGNSRGVPSKDLVEKARPGMRLALMLSHLHKEYGHGPGGEGGAGAGAGWQAFAALLSQCGSRRGRFIRRQRQPLLGASRRRGGVGRGELDSVALKDLSLDLFEGETFAFLGHSGCGKSTVLNILAGLLKPSGGEAFLYGYSLTKSELFIHTLVGVCPQQHIALPYLTVREQLQFFAAIKGRLDRIGPSRPGVSAGQGPGAAGAQQQQQQQQQEGGEAGSVEEVMWALGLQGWADKPAYELSTSQQRKLSLAIALIGDPQVLLLDEPTAGMDQSSRKQVWDILASRRAGRVVVFATQSMEEADVAADRKAILSHGTLKCCGSSLYLRNRFGLSYLLHVTKGAVFKGAALIDLIHVHIPSAAVVVASARRLRGFHFAAVNSAAEHVTYRLPMAEAGGSIGPLLVDLAEHSAELGVEDAALEATTLEEVFMRFLGEGAEEADKVAGSLLDDEEEAVRLGRLPHAMGGHGVGAEEEEDSLLMRHNMAAAQAPNSSTGGVGGSSSSSNGSGGRGAGGGGAVIDMPTGTTPVDGGGGGVRVGAVRREKRAALLVRQAKALFFVRMAGYRRNLGHALGTFGIPLAFALAAFLIQAVFLHDNSSSTALTFSSTSPSLATDTPIIYTVADENRLDDAKKVLGFLGPNHAYLPALHFAQRFNSSYLNTQTNAAGSTAVGISFTAIDLAACQIHYVVVHQPWHIHQVPQVKTVIDNAFLQVLSRMHGLAGSPQTVEVVNHPLYYDKLPFVFGFFLAAVVAVGLLLVPPVLCAQVVAEREVGLRSLLHVNGMRGTPLWSATLAADCALFWLCMLAITLVGLAFGHAPFTVGALPLLLFQFGLAAPALVLFSYVFSFSFDVAQAAVSFLSLFLLIAAVIPYILILSLPASSFVIPHVIACTLDPPYALIAGLHLISAYISGESSPAAASLPYASAAAVPASAPAAEYYVAHPQLYPILLCFLGMLAGCLVFILRLAQLHTGEEDPDLAGAGDLAAMMGPEEDEGDDDVVRERARMQESAALWDRQAAAGEAEGEEEGDLIICSSLGKNFGATSGVCGLGREYGRWVLRDLWMGVKRGEVVVLVGGEKSGKSTLLNCLAGATPLSYGDALINGASVRYSLHNHADALGFCPQGEVLYGYLTVREHLEVMAHVKGVLEPVATVVHALMDSLHLTADADVQLHNCRPAVVRKVSVAVALLGGPSVLLLDEPCQGLDVKSRRDVWNKVQAESGQRATLICTQSVEDAEALGARVGILVGGKLKCLGSPQTLKARYGSAYTLTVSIAPERIPSFRSFLFSLFPSATLLERLHDQDDFTPITPSPASQQATGLPPSGELHRPFAPALSPSSRVAAAAATAAAAAPAAATTPGSEHEATAEISLHDEHDTATAAGPAASAGGSGSKAGAGAGLQSVGVSARFRVPVQGLAELARLVSALERRKAELGVDEYTVSQPTLQQVFHYLTRGGGADASAAGGSGAARNSRMPLGTAASPHETVALRGGSSSTGVQRFDAAGAVDAPHANGDDHAVSHAPLTAV